MQYNILPNSTYTLNTTLGNKDLEYGYLKSIIEYGSTAVTTLNSNDVLVIDIDLGIRVSLARLEYKFETLTSGSLPASGISFSFKEESAYSDYTDLITITSGTSSFYSSISGSLFTPRYLRLTHSLGTTSGVVYGFAAFTDEVVVGFGAVDELVESTFETPRNNEAIIKAIPIYNNGLTTADAEISIDLTGTDFDETISISTGPTGPWSYSKIGDFELATIENFSSGFFEDTTTMVDDDGILNLAYAKDVDTGNLAHPATKGMYATRIFTTDNIVQERILINKIFEESVGSLAVDRHDNVDTIEYRSSDSKPYSHFFTRYITTTYPSSYRKFFLTDKTFPDEATTTYSLEIDSISTASVVAHETVMSKINNNTAGWYRTYSSSSSSSTQMSIFSVIDNTSSSKYKLAYHSSSGSYLNASVYYTKITSSTGIWVYFFCQSYRDSDFVNQTGYYLAHFSSSMSNTFKSFKTSKDVGCMDVAKDSTYLWHTIPASNTVYKLSSTGTNVFSYENSVDDITSDLGPIAVLPEETGVWLANGGDLHKINSLEESTDPLDSIYGVIDTSISLMSLDPADYEHMWVAWPGYVGLLHLSGDRKGTFLFYKPIEDVDKLEPVESGCWVRTANTENASDDYFKFLSKENQRVEYSNALSNISMSAAKEIPYDNDDYLNNFPEKSFNPWYGLAWKKVVLDNFLIPEEKYMQLRLSFWPRESSITYPNEPEYISSDDFNQNTLTPRDIIWSDWRDKTVGDGLDRVYVDTTEKELVLTTGATSSYIRTKDRMLVSRSDDNAFDIRFKYRIGTGAATANQDIYGYLYSIDSDRVFQYFFFRVYCDYSNSRCIPYFGNEVNISYASTVTTGWQQAWDTTMRFTVYESSGSYFINAGIYIDGAWNLINSASPGFTSFPGQNMWFQILTPSSNTVPTYIENFEVLAGQTSFYYANPTRVESIYIKQPTILSSIAPGTSKNIYIKNQIPQSLSLGSNYETNLKARWEIPSY